jgi:hypothetical protein
LLRQAEEEIGSASRTFVLMNFQLFGYIAVRGREIMNCE